MNQNDERILCTFPGKVGDILWAMPTVREISRAAGRPVDFCYNPDPGAVGVGQSPGCNLGELLSEQRYIHHAFPYDAGWVPSGWGEQLQPNLENPMMWPQFAYRGYDRIVNLGYPRWPEMLLAHETWRTAAEHVGNREMAPLEWTPWIEHPTTRDGSKLQHGQGAHVVIGFTDEWAELKMGLIYALFNAEFRSVPGITVLVPPAGSRLLNEWINPDIDSGGYLSYTKGDLTETAAAIASADLFVGCLSSLAVLAAGLGKPRVLIEPSPARQNPIFAHWDTPLVQGGDGRPTFDARALVQAVREKLEGIHAAAR